MNIVIINGPNLNMLGKRESVYGTQTYDELVEQLKQCAAEHNADISVFQSNSEGALIDRIHGAVNESADAIIINPGGLTHYSISLADALRCFSGIKIEVHISNIYAREPFRHMSYVSPVCTAVISGCGTDGYISALEYVIKQLKK